MKGIESGGGTGKPRKKVSPPKGHGPLAPKPAGVFAAPVKAPSVKAKPVARPKPQKAAPAALDVLPTRKGQNSRPYKPPVAKTVVRKAAKVKAAAQHEARDTKGNADRSRAAQFLAAHPEILHPPKPKPHGSLLATITGAAKAGSELGAKLAPFAVSAQHPGVVLDDRSKKTISDVGKHGAQDLIDLPANTVTSTYLLGKTAIHDPAKAAGMITDPYVQAAKDPFGSFVDHPVNTLLLASGVKGGIGRGVGKALRTAPSDTLKRLGSTERPIESPGNIRASTPKPYSKDSITKARQVTVEKAQARRAKKKGRPAPVRVMSEKDIAKRVDADVAVGRTVAGHNEKVAAKKAQKALGRKPTAATSAVAQGLTDGSVADLQALIAHYRTKATTLDGEALKQNQATLALLEDALKKHDPARVVAAARAYADVRAPGEAETVARGFVKPDVAEATRLAGVAVRRHGVQTGAEAPKVARQAAKDSRQSAARSAKAARRKVAAANQDFEKAYANARVSGATAKSSAELRAAEKTQREARAELAKAQRAVQATRHRTAVAAERANTNVARVAGSARVAEVRGQAVAERVQGRARVAVERAAGNAKASEARTKSSPTLVAAERDLRSSKRKLAKLRDFQRGNPYSVTGASRLKAAKEEVAGHQSRVRAARARIRGVAPREADAVRLALQKSEAAKPASGLSPAEQARVWKALDEQVAARSTRASAPVKAGEGVRAARAKVREADRVVSVSRSRVRGVDPAAADALLKAIGNRDEAHAAVNVARGTAKTARRAHIDVKEGIKAGAYVGPNGKLIPLPVVRASKGPVEPVYVSHNPGGDVRPAAVPTEPPTVSVKAARSGKALDEGTIDLHPDRLIKQAGDSQRKLDAAKNYQRFLDDFAHRKTKDLSPEVYGNTGSAEAAATELRNKTGIDWVSARTFDGNYHLVPAAAAKRLAQHAQHTDNFMGAFTRQWSKNVLAFSPRWLAGQAIEPGLRSAVAHAGPRSMLTTRRVLKGIEKEHGPEAVDQFKARTMSSGLQSAALRPLEHTGAQKEAGRLSSALHSFAKAPGPKQLGQLYNLTTQLTMGTLNHLVQNPSQYAMVGKAIRDSDVMSKHTVKLSQAAIDDFVRTGGKDVNVQARLGREVERMNGKYNGFSPKMQAAIAGYTPFLAWTLSATNFLFNVLPRDHPVLTSLLASSNEATEAWRKANGLYMDPFDGSVQGFLQGSVPGKAGSHLRLGRYVPFGLGNDDTPFLGPYADAILPQASGVIAAVKGEDFTGTKLTGSHGLSPSLARKAEAAASSIGKGVVPLATQIATLAGVHTPDNADSRKVKPTLKARARGQFDPFVYTPGSNAAAISSGSSSGKPGALPPGVSQRELDQLVRDARNAARQPQVSQAEIDALLKATR